MKKLSLKALFCLICALNSINVFSQKISGTLPVVYVNTENHKPITSKEEYLTADCWIDPLNTGFEAAGSQSDPLLLNIRGRGNYTWVGFDKKPYKMKFDKKQALLGMKKSKHYALLAHADDDMGFMRNTLGFELSRRLGLPWTPTQQPVELVLNGEYRGIYFLTENIRVDEDRVNIVEQKDNVSDPAAITGGWLVEIDNYDSDPHVTIYDDGHRWGTDLYITYHTPEVLSSAQENYLRNQMQMINDMFVDQNKNTAPWIQYVDLDQLVRYYIVQEIMDDAESFHGSCYLYKDLGDTEKWKFGPVWDFGNSFRRGDSELFIYQRPPFGQAWIGEIAKFAVFQDKVKEVWAEFIDEDYADLNTFLKNFVSQIKSGAQSDYQRWPQYGNSNVQADYDQLWGMVQRRVKWLNDQWGSKPIDPVPDPVETPIYLRGSFNNWTLTTPFEYDESDGLYYVREISTGDSDFKIADEKWSVYDFGSNGELLSLGVPYKLAMVGDNINVSEPLEDVDFILDLNGPTLTVIKHINEQPEPDPDPDPDPIESDVYLRGDFNNWSVEHPFSLMKDGLYYIIDLSIGTSRFKVADAEWGDINFGSNGEQLWVNQPYTMTPFTNENITAYEPLDHMDFVFDLDNGVLRVVETGTLGIGGNVADSELTVFGNMVTAPGEISIYDLTGRLLQRGYGPLRVNAKGMLIIRTDQRILKRIF